MHYLHQNSGLQPGNNAHAFGCCSATTKIILKCVHDYPCCVYIMNNPMIENLRKNNTVAILAHSNRSNEQTGYYISGAATLEKSISAVRIRAIEDRHVNSETHANGLICDGTSSKYHSKTEREPYKPNLHPKRDQAEKHGKGRQVILRVRLFFFFFSTSAGDSNVPGCPWRLCAGRFHYF